MLTTEKFPQKPHLLKIQRPPARSFIIKGDAIAWNNPWHFHPEVELLYCIRGKGVNFVGTYMAPIEEGELLLFGKNLPHTRQRDKAYYQRCPDEQPETIVIQFAEDFLGEAFFRCQEMRPIQLLLANAQRGIKFLGETRQEACRQMERLRLMGGAEALIGLLGLLNGLSLSSEYLYLNPESYLSVVNDRDAQKINRVYAYTAKHYHEAISLATVSALVSLTPHAFCRYFKARTRKSYTHYLAEVRITRACELLMEGNKDIKEICFSSGFNHLSNFHKWFRRLMHISPAAYREQAQQKMPDAGR